MLHEHLIYLRGQRNQVAYLKNDDSKVFKSNARCSYLYLIKEESNGAPTFGGFSFAFFFYGFQENSTFLG